MCMACGNDKCLEEAMEKYGIIATDTGLVARQGPPRMPKQRKTIGVPGYLKPVVLYDPQAPSVDLVQEDEPVYDPAADENRQTPVAPPSVVSLGRVRRLAAAQQVLPVAERTPEETKDAPAVKTDRRTGKPVQTPEEKAAAKKARREARKRELADAANG